MIQHFKHLKLGREIVTINYESRGTFKVIHQIKFKTSIIRANLCGYSDAYIYFKEIITITEAKTDAVKEK